MEGILLVDKSSGCTSFSLVALLRRICHVQKIGHAGTLDPFATGVMVMLIGRSYTKLADQFLEHDKEYLAKIHLGIATNTYDVTGTTTTTSAHIPSLADIEKALIQFQGTVLQVPPMFSAKKLQGKKLYELARRNVEVERAPCTVHLHTTLISYSYPILELRIACSKGTYIRSIAHDLGVLLGCGAHVAELIRVRSGPFSLEDCLPLSQLKDSCILQSRLIKSPPVQPLSV